MSNSTQSGSPGANTNGKPGSSEAKASGNLAFWLVIIMLVSLFGLVLVLLVIVYWLPDNKDVMEFSKWTLSVLLGAFGAWIGAGAAYFFGKENLAESSRSTEQAMRIQQGGLLGMTKPERIKDIALTTMNKEFMFKPTAKKKAVIEKLTKYKGYWWVPVLDKDGKGILVDIIHAQVFWDTPFKDSDSISKILSDIETKSNLKAKFGELHGASFFVTANPDDKIDDVTDKMNKSGAAVGVIVDEKGKPSYCFTKRDLLPAQK